MGVFFLGSWGMNQSAGQTDRVNREVVLGRFNCSFPVRTPEIQVENTSSVSPACRKRRLKGRRYIAIVADTA